MTNEDGTALVDLRWLAASILRMFACASIYCAHIAGFFFILSKEPLNSGLQMSES